MVLRSRRGRCESSYHWNDDGPDRPDRACQVGLFMRLSTASCSRCLTSCARKDLRISCGQILANLRAAFPDCGKEIIDQVTIPGPVWGTAFTKPFGAYSETHESVGQVEAGELGAGFGRLLSGGQCSLQLFDSLVDGEAGGALTGRKLNKCLEKLGYDGRSG
jgi:hypothetical protein